MKHQENLDSALKVRSALIELQRELLNFLKDGFEKENERTITPSEWLQMIITAQRYAWLRELTSLVADIDLLTELHELTVENVGLVRHEVERLFFNLDPATCHSEFNKQYMILMKLGAPFMVAHGILRGAVKSLPTPTKTWELEDAAAARKQWHQDHHTQSRKRRS